MFQFFRAVSLSKKIPRIDRGTVRQGVWLMACILTKIDCKNKKGA
jgi:hypothetical protein